MQKQIPLRGELLKQHSLARYTSWHVGGPAKQFYKPADIADLCAFLQSLPANENIVWLGLGSNVLIRDAGIDGTVIYTQGRLKGLESLDEFTIRAEAGVTCAKLARFCTRSHLNKGAFFAGIPGTVGGALAMNAGAFGGETWEQVVEVETIDKQGKLRKRLPADFEVSYRHVKRPDDEWFVAGSFAFPQGEATQAKQAIRDLLSKRSDTQPIGEFSCGSVFRNPPGDHAARLIEATGLKGNRVGGAWVSEKHANFIINGGAATASDIETLIQHVATCVEDAQGIRLIPEVHMLGD